ncbi:hypothetical protein Taro_031168 [Colocasia esculenta]|uniref:Pectinesterase n=1 Tax=Colocasia esculenta TaxID=4460 RepID=A0A843W2D2_COLES|nr:hypothetical protein [Colocasia esculenta]
MREARIMRKPVLPYPEVCHSLHSSDPFAAEAKILLGFAQYNLQATTDRAQRVHQLASTVNMDSLEARTRAAWADCLELSKATLSHLGRLTGSAGTTTSPDDAQTWLSAAVANQQTCRNGFLELNLASKLWSLPFTSNNVSELLSNSLAMHKAGAASRPSGARRLLSGGFPTWISVFDRKFLQSPTMNADVVVATDGSGNYTTISEAVAAWRNLRTGTERFVIYVKAGVYRENVEVHMNNLMLVGDGIDKTVVTGSRNVPDGRWTTFRSATFAAVGDGFIARDMTFENTAGPEKRQAVALRSGSDLSIFYRCSFKGYQDTLYVHSQRQFYRECDVYGTVDFIFGDAVVVLQNCNIFVRRPMDNQTNTVTAQGRIDPNQNTGISIHNSTVTAALDFKPVQGSFKTFLGRPWRNYSRTVFMQSNLDDLIDPAGWLEWDDQFALCTLYYGEYENTGVGAGTGERISWPGYHIITCASEAQNFTVSNFLSGDLWIPENEVPFSSGLL